VKRYAVKVRLVCGCAVSFRIGPLESRAKYPCPSNLGHGYRVAWTEWTDTVTKKTHHNYRLAVPE